MTTISELRDGAKKVNVTGEITSKDAPREAGGGQVCDFTLKDDSGQVKLVLWNEQVDMADVGSRVSVENGYTSTYRGELQLNVGKYGHFAVLEKNPPRKEAPKTNSKKLESYYSGIDSLQETDLAGANQLLREGWVLEKIEMKHVSVPTPEGLTHESAYAYVLSHRAN